MKNKKGFTLIELLAVIVILGIILTIATTSVIKNINDSKAKAKYIAAEEITTIGSTYLAVNNIEECVEVLDLIEEGYVEEDATNPRTGENGSFKLGDKICKTTEKAQDGFASKEGKYIFEGYEYRMANSSTQGESVKGDVNKDGKITKEDAELILKMASSSITPTEEQKKLADVNEDGKITAVDARKVLQMVDVLIGDVNKDGKITKEDAELILKMASSSITPTEEQKKLADVNEDGKITAVDARIVSQMVDVLIGDVNKDGKITKEDAELILKMASSSITPTEEQKKLADVNEDGKITAVDARIVLQFIK